MLGITAVQLGVAKLKKKHIMLYTPLTVWMNVQLSVKLLLGCTLH